MNGISVAVYSASANEGDEFLMTFYACNESVGTRQHMSVQCRPMCDRKPVIVFLRLKEMNCTRHELIGHDNKPGDNKFIRH